MDHREKFQGMRDKLQRMMEGGEGSSRDLGPKRKVHKRLSFESPVRENVQNKRLQFDMSSEEEEDKENLLRRGKVGDDTMERLCFDLKNFSPCRTRSGTVYIQKSDDSTPMRTRKIPVSRLTLCPPSISPSPPSSSSPSPPSRSLSPIQLFCSVESPKNSSMFVSKPNMSMSSEKLANVNPFTPSAMQAQSNRKRPSSRSSSGRSSLGSSISSVTNSFDLDTDDEEDYCTPPKRIRATDVQVNRYEEEFLELNQLAKGQYGNVTCVRHRLDGIMYAIKSTKESVKGGTNAERMATKEVFAHAVLIKHKHVVRYYNSWVEEGKIYIQTEYCEGGSLDKKIQDLRVNGSRFTEMELKKILTELLMGIQYIHSKNLVHLDIKPDNVLIAEENKKNINLSTDRTSDFGGSDCDEDGEDERSYKIGDLGHVCQVYGGDFCPEEGDCRYMAPEFLEMEQDRSKLPKADIFSLGMTMYEAASLKVIPKNSLESEDYNDHKVGRLPYLEEYSSQFNQMLQLMVKVDPDDRPTPEFLLNMPYLQQKSDNMSSQDLFQELQQTREKLLKLEQMLQGS